MAHAAPRIDRRLVRFVERAADSDARAAEVCRLVGEAADELALPRPSYEQVRRLLKLFRSIRPEPRLGRVAIEVALRSKPPEAFVDEAVEAFIRARDRAESK